MEMQLNRIIVLFFFYTSVLMSQIVSEKEENLKFSQIDFFRKKQNLKCKTTKNNIISSYKEDYFFDRKIREDRVLDDLDRLFQNQVSKSLPNTLKNNFY